MASLRVETRYAASWPGYDQGVQNVNDARDFSLPSEVSHRDVGVTPDVAFASDRSGRWYAQTKQRSVWWQGQWYGVQLWINGTPAKGCVRLQAGDVLELEAYRGGEASVVRWRAVLLEEQSPSAIVQSSETSLFDALGNDELGAIIGQLGGHSTDTYALAATCRAGRAAVLRWLAPLIDKTQRERSLWQLVGERWPLAVLHAKLDASPQVCEQQLLEMLSSGPTASMKRLSGFPFAAHITKGWELPRVASGPPQFVPATGRRSTRAHRCRPAP